MAIRAGRAFAFADPERRLGVCYVMNAMGTILSAIRAECLASLQPCKAAHRCVQSPQI